MCSTSMKQCAALCALLFLAACGRPQYQYLDTKDARVEEVKVREEGDFLVVNAVLKNDDKRGVTHTVYRVEWFDKDGMLVEKSAWRPLSVRGAANVYVRERSTVPGAKEFTIVISNDPS